MGLIPIQGIDIEKGIAMTGGTEDAYRQVLSIFRKDTEERLQRLRFFIYETMNTGTGMFPEKHLTSFITQIYALKSVLATIGAETLTQEAYKLEIAGKDKDLVFITNNLPDFIEHLAELAKNVRTVIDGKTDDGASKQGGSSFLRQIFSRQKQDKAQGAKIENADLITLFEKLVIALKSHNVSEVDPLLFELSKSQTDSKTKEIINHISDEVLMTEFSSAITTINEFINTNK
jgi:HPt (histidine-containing phosphotransfer) domain-containing protein